MASSDAQDAAIETISSFLQDLVGDDEEVVRLERDHASVTPIGNGLKPPASPVMMTFPENGGWDSFNSSLGVLPSPSSLKYVTADGSGGGKSATVSAPVSSSSSSILGLGFSPFTLDGMMVSAHVATAASAPSLVANGNHGDLSFNHATDMLNGVGNSEGGHSTSESVPLSLDELYKNPLTKTPVDTSPTDFKSLLLKNNTTDILSVASSMHMGSLKKDAPEFEPPPSSLPSVASVASTTTSANSNTVVATLAKTPTNIKEGKGAQGPKNQSAQRAAPSVAAAATGAQSTQLQPIRAFLNGESPASGEDTDKEWLSYSQLLYGKQIGEPPSRGATPESVPLNGGTHVQVASSVASPPKQKQPQQASKQPAPPAAQVVGAQISGPTTQNFRPRVVSLPAPATTATPATINAPVVGVFAGAMPGIAPAARPPFVLGAPQIQPYRPPQMQVPVLRPPAAYNPPTLQQPPPSPQPVPVPYLSHLYPTQLNPPFRPPYQAVPTTLQAVPTTLQAAHPLPQAVYITVPVPQSYVPPPPLVRGPEQTASDLRQRAQGILQSIRKEAVAAPVAVPPHLVAPAMQPPFVLPARVNPASLAAQAPAILPQVALQQKTLQPAPAVVAAPAPQQPTVAQSQVQTEPRTKAQPQTEPQSQATGKPQTQVPSTPTSAPSQAQRAPSQSGQKKGKAQLAAPTPTTTAASAVAPAVPVVSPAPVAQVTKKPTHPPSSSPPTSVPTTALGDDSAAAAPPPKKSGSPWATVAKFTAEAAPAVSETQATSSTSSDKKEPEASSDGWVTVRSMVHRGPAFSSSASPSTASISPSSVVSRPPLSKSGKNWIKPTVERKGKADPEELKKFNMRNFPLEPKGARHFVIKSYSEEDIHKSIKYAIWASTDQGNQRLDKAFRESKGPIFLFFSCNGSGHFQGMAQMTTEVDYQNSSDVWAENKWKGHFKVQWFVVKDLPNHLFRHIKLENNEGKPVTNSRDTQEVPLEQGREVVKIFDEYPLFSSILDDFNDYDAREASGVKKLGGAIPAWTKVKD